MVPVNYSAVLLGAISNMIIGFLWYGPLFGKPWSEMMGLGIFSPEAQKEMQKKMMPGYIASFIGALAMAFVLAHAIIFASAYLKTSGVSAGLTGAFWNWLGFIAPVTIGVIFWESKPLKLWLINASYWLVSLLVMGVILSLWV